MALELRPNCEYCDRDLPPDALEGVLQIREAVIKKR